jgi:hypothetical protein
LLTPVMAQGRRLQAPEPLATIRDRVGMQLAALPTALRAGATTPPYLVDVAPELRELTAKLDRETH